MTIESVIPEKNEIKIKGELIKNLEKGFIVECVSRKSEILQIRSTTAEIAHFDLIKVENPIFEPGDLLVINENTIVKV